MIDDVVQLYPIYQNFPCSPNRKIIVGQHHKGWHTEQSVLKAGMENTWALIRHIVWRVFYTNKSRSGRTALLRHFKLIRKKMLTVHGEGSFSLGAGKKCLLARFK